MVNESLPMLTVSRLAALLKEVVEDNFAQVLVEGEISNFSVPASGHFYFSLKDENAQLRSVMFRTQARLLPFRPENGMQVILSGRVSLYPQRGEVQLVAEKLEPRGVGSLQVAFEQLKNRLAAEGLFAETHKRPLPTFPRTVGVVTSATGAAIHDILNVLRRRGAGLRVVLRPVRVQGEGAAEEIAEAIADHNRLGVADVLIVGRGGGSLEDLWAFNEETVARAIHASAIPVISAVGHEVDTTIADFVADLRAPTPSAAAELVARSRLELEGHLDHLAQRLAGQMQGRLALLDERVRGLARRLRSPRQQLVMWQQRHADLARRLGRAMAQRQQETEGRLATLAGRLDLLSPLRTLERGYAIALAEKTGTAVLDAGTLARGDRLQLRFARGRATATVEETGE
jgi:exodeoxyribonuclease VII large subunit